MPKGEIDLGEFDPEEVLEQNVNELVQNAQKKATWPKSALEALPTVSFRMKLRLITGATIGLVVGVIETSPSIGLASATSVVVADVLIVSLEELFSFKRKIERRNIQKSPQLQGIADATQTLLEETIEPEKDVVTSPDVALAVQNVLHPFWKSSLGRYALSLIRKKNISLDLWLKGVSTKHQKD